jgi:hypothetical protein
MIRQVLKLAITCSFRQSSSSLPAGFLNGVILPFPMYPLSPTQLAGSTVTRTRTRQGSDYPADPLE